MKKSAIIISILITTLVLGTVAGVVKAVSVSQTNAKVQELEQTIQAREELYKQTIEEANTRLAQFQTNSAGIEQVLQLARIRLFKMQGPQLELLD